MGLPKQPGGSSAAHGSTQARKRAGAAAATNSNRDSYHHQSALSFFLFSTHTASSSCTSPHPCWCTLQAHAPQNFFHTTGGDGREAAPASNPVTTSAHTSDRTSQTGSPFAFGSRSPDPVHDLRVLASEGAGSTTALPTAC